MTRDFPKISAAQLFCIMLLSRLTMDVIAPPPVPESPVEALCVIAVTELVRLAIASPLIFYSFRRDNVHRSLYRKNRFLGWLSAVFACVLLVGAAAKTLFHGTDFAYKNLLVGGTAWAVIAAAAAFALYLVYMGVEAAARAGVLFLIAAAIITAAVFLADIPYMQISPMWRGSGFGTFFKDVLRCFSNGGEYLVFAALLPYVNREKSSSAGNSVLWFALISTVVSAGMCAVNYLILREMYPLAEYPFIASASLADIALFKRLDGICAAVWELCAAFRTGLMLLAAVCVVTSVVRAAREQKSSKSER
ncbi:MAG: GerAB/ArcD/ProY family transporter [Oscillospiraceae bacterium]